MCGILVSINSKYSLNELNSSLSLMKHRGPDFQDGKFISPNVYFGHTRLSILDLNPRSNQPFFYKSYCIVFNGEVYNYKELITEFSLITTTSSDTEVIMLMYEKFGQKCLDYFIGMFSFAIYDNLTKEVFVVRDRLGIKPLYYFNEGDTWIFSSEIRPIQELVNSSIDETGIRMYRKLRMTVNNYTIYSKIKFFPSGNFWIKSKFKTYWELEIYNKVPPKDDELHYLISDAVQLRKRSDVPIGSYLSGGLDSTILSYLLKPTHTWTVGFQSLNEFNWSSLANKALKSDHHQIIVNREQFLESAEFIVKNRLEPLSVPNEVLIYLMTKEVKKENTVVLSGEGADELFWGYDRIFKWAKKAKSIELTEFNNYYCYGSNSDNEILEYALEGLKGELVIDKIAYFFQIKHLHGLLRRLDNSTMLSSVEARVPFVDHRLVEMMAGTPFEWKMGSSFKEPLKRIFNDLIPREIVGRKKVGFPVPLEEIFSSEEFGNKDITAMDKWLIYNLNLLRGV